jgi:hypothetical protein
MSHEFIEGAQDDLEPKTGSGRSGGPPHKLTLTGVLDPQCPRCGKRFPSKTEESAMRKIRNANRGAWERIREKASRKVCMCTDEVGNTFAQPTA